MSKFIVVKLVGGQDVMAKLIEETDTSYKLESPMVMTVDTDRIMYLALAPFSPMDEQVELSKQHVLFDARPLPHMIDQFDDLMNGKLPQATPVDNE